MQYDVLLSYASQDKHIVDRLAAYLEYYNIRVFVAHRDVPADVAWANAISEAVRYSRMVVALYSDDFNSSPWLDRELAWAFTSGVPILTVCLTTAPYCEGKAEYLQGTMCLDAMGKTEAKFPAIYESVCNMLAIPIESTQPVDEVLPSEASQPVSEPEKESEAPSPAKEQKTEVAVDTSHHLLRAFVVGFVLLSLAMLLLEYLIG